MGKKIIELSNYLRSVADKPFKWGEHDCVLHACNGLLALTEVDIASSWRGTYNTKKQSEEIIVRDFNGNSDNCFTNFLGEPHENPRRARRGDIVRVTFGKSLTYGVVDDTGRFIVFVSVKEGLIRYPIERAEKIWNSDNVWRCQCLQ